MRYAALALVPLLLVSAPSRAQKGNGPCIGVAISGDGQPPSSGPAAFSATKILDVTATAILLPKSKSGFESGDHVMEFRFLLPDGHLYQSMAVPFTANAALAGTGQKVDGYPRPMKRQSMREVTYQGALQLGVTATLPVAGTLIVQSSLYGKWIVEAIVDGNASKCSNPGAFTLAR